MVNFFSGQEDAALLNFSVESAENGEKQQNVATALLFDLQNKLVKCLISK